MFWLSKHAVKPFVIIGMVAIGVAVLAKLGTVLVPTFVLFVCVSGALWWWQHYQRAGRSGRLRQVVRPDCVPAVTDSCDLDQLTGLLNRQGFDNWLGRLVDSQCRDDPHVSVLFVDIERFTNINNSLGHATGDRLIQRLSERLMSSLPSECTIARMSADKFLIAIPASAAQSAACLAARVLSEIKKPFLMDNSSLVISASIGVASWPFEGMDSSEIVTSAELAMCRAKQQGRGRYCVFTPELRKSIRKQCELSVQLERASLSEFFVRFQPKVDIGNGQVIGFESLLRWNHPEHGEVLPGVFIEIAEDTERIVELGKAALLQVCQQIKAWGHLAKPVAINVSAVQLQRDDFISEFFDVLDGLGIAPDMIEIEITESVLISNVVEISRKIRQLRAGGIRIALDDFGTGYSSLSYLTSLPIDTLKIDRSFVSKLLSSKETEAIIGFMVNLSRSIGVTLVAEGIENTEQASKLLELGCVTGQGWLYGQPLLAVDATSVLTSHHREAVASIV